MDNPRAARVVGAAGLATAAVVAFAVWYTDWNRPIVFTCDEASVGRACRDTEQSILSWPEMVFYPELPKKLRAVEIGLLPGASIKPEPYEPTTWRAVLTLDDRSTWMASCVYSSDDMVSCVTDSGPIGSSPSRP
ncbi:MAG TPA: hypothetical protein VFJ71_05715 [Candidatus Limnocylindrales bacterium]|nr:hypothetical protein [Candidatus Limnocylindrales bacterium]